LPGSLNPGIFRAEVVLEWRGGRGGGRGYSGPMCVEVELGHPGGKGG
jgi:hypothetical protein